MLEVKQTHDLEVVVLVQDLPLYGLKRGAIGTIVEVFNHPEEAYMVEFVEVAGTGSIVADWIKPEQIERLRTII